MIPVDPLWLLALPILFGLGWFTARLDRRQSTQPLEARDRNLIRAAEILVSQTDAKAALPYFIEAIRDFPDALSLHVATGVLFRRIGEPDRAIEVHLSILGREKLDDDLREATLYELGQDYMAAGVMDRAQDCLVMLETSSRYAEHAQCLLVDLFQRQRRWSDALSVLDRLDACRARPDVAKLRFHLLMELGLFDKAREISPDHPRLNSPSRPSSSEVPYVCGGCGFQLRNPAWQCPGCRGWDSFRPIA